ncbi:MAG: hypothetical protein ACJ8AG_24520 [Ktedonobacteraceae bacterium]
MHIRLNGQMYANYNGTPVLSRYHYVRESSRLVRYNIKGHLAICWIDELVEDELDAGMG